MGSISQKGAAAGRPAAGAAVPDFRNFGTQLRFVLVVNLLLVPLLLARNARWADLPGEALDLAARVELPLLAVALTLYLLAPLLRRLPAAAGWAAVVLLAVAMSLLYAVLAGPLLGVADLSRVALWAAAGALAVLTYFALRVRIYTPALAEARMMALNARIRPHFLFNSINAVLGTMRADPRRAERALEEMSDLFRVLMRDNTELTDLGEEIALGRQYLELEKLRLGERLLVRWEIDTCPPAARVPPLMLQPLLENAVYHGIEPASGPGEVVIGIASRGEDLEIAVSNPFHGERTTTPGNRMALENIKERLMLFYDLEARLDSRVESTAAGPRYCVHIRLPLARSRA